MTVRRRGAAALLAVAALAAATLAGCATSSPSAATGQAPAATADVAAPAELTEAQASLLAAAQEAVNARPEVLGSAFFDAAAGTVVVRRAPGVTDAAARAALATALDPAVRTLPLTVGTRSAAQIGAALDGALDLAFPDGTRAHAAVYDAPTDTIQVQVTDPTTATPVVRAGLGPGAVVVAGQAPSNLVSDAALQNAFPTRRWFARSPFPGGAAYAVKNQGADLGAGGCTTGFAWRGPNGEQWMITAGHCYPIQRFQQRAFTRNTAGSAPFWTVPLGSAIATSYQTGVGTFPLKGAQRGDIAVLQIQPGSTSGPRIYLGSGSPTLHPVIGTTTRRPVAGDKICLSGAVSGELCGFTVKSATTSYDVKGTTETVHGVTLATGKGTCPTHGDSGSPVYIKDGSSRIIAKGILDAVAGNGSTLLPCQVWFTPIQNVTAAWGGRIAQI